MDDCGTLRINFLCNRDIYLPFNKATVQYGTWNKKGYIAAASFTLAHSKIEHGIWRLYNSNAKKLPTAVT